MIGVKSSQIIDFFQHLMNISLSLRIFVKVEKYIRCDDGGWKYFSYEDMGQTFKIESIECELPLSEIYYRVEFEVSSEYDQHVEPTARKVAVDHPRGNAH